MLPLWWRISTANSTAAVVTIVAAPVIAVIGAAFVPGLAGEHFASDSTGRESGLSAAALWHYALETLVYAGGTTALAIAPCPPRG